MESLISEDGHHIGTQTRLNDSIFLCSNDYIQLRLKITTQTVPEIDVFIGKEILMNILLVDDDRFIIRSVFINEKIRWDRLKINNVYG